MKSFLITTKKEMQKRGYEQLDIIFICGDAYIDHHSFGCSLLGRYLESHGYTVGIISQPDWKDVEDFKRLGKPRLFFGVSSGNVDSMVANYSANKRLRKEDAFSPDNKSGMRPDRAVIRYSNCIRQAFKDSIIVLGGIESSLRRLSHYDYWSNKVRRSILLDSKADILVYGMGERAVLEISKRLESFDINSLDHNKRYYRELEGIRGTVIVRSECSQADFVEIPSFEEVSDNKQKFIDAFRVIYGNQDPYSAKVIVQKNGNRYVIHNKPSLPLSTDELDAIYELPFLRCKHPMYRKSRLKAEEMIVNSLVSHRGCPGQCNFCGLYFHQGRIVQSRSKTSILKEVDKLVSSPLFRGTITDVGGPSANLYMAECESWKAKGACTKRQCMMPKKCSNLKLAYDKQMNLLKAVKRVAGVKHVFLSSGLRYDLLVDKMSRGYLKYICENHISGQMKVAPEHLSDNTLRFMNKPSSSVYRRFVEQFNSVVSTLSKKIFLVNYFIIAHPGSTLKDAKIIADYMKEKYHQPEQVQDYIPLPMTVSGAIYYTGIDPISGDSVGTLKEISKRKEYRALIQYKAKKKSLNKSKKWAKRIVFILFYLCTFSCASAEETYDRVSLYNEFVDYYNNRVAIESSESEKMEEDEEFFDKNEVDEDFGPDFDDISLDDEEEQERIKRLKRRKEIEEKRKLELQELENERVKKVSNLLKALGYGDLVDD